MRYLGWILAFLFAAAGLGAYFILYAPLERGYEEQKKEIKMWTDRVAELEGNSVIVPGDTLTPDTGTKISPVNTSGAGTLIATIQVDDLFSSAQSTEISTSGKTELDKLLPTLRTVKGEIIIMVHSDNVRVSDSLKDFFPTNWELTARRAAIIARYLLSKGVDYSKLVPCGMSAARPLSDNTTEEGRTKNRRVEIYVR